jgi:hypothetical protein
VIGELRSEGRTEELMENCLLEDGDEFEFILISC